MLQTARANPHPHRHRGHVVHKFRARRLVLGSSLGRASEGECLSKVFIAVWSCLMKHL